MKFRAFLFVLMIAGPAFAQDAASPQSAGAPATAMTPAPDDRAKQWLNLVDDQNYGGAYKQMSVATQDKTSLNWMSKVSGARSPLGAMASRNIKDVKLTKIRPGMRDGQSATVRFDSSFAHKAAAVETVTLTSEKGGWSVVSYQIN